MGPKFSILVPTRQRPDTLEHTLASLVCQTGDDYEIVVADNCGDKAVQDVIDGARARTSKVRHVRSDQVLPMAENWERGLLATSGQYVTVLGDDDALMPSTLARLRAIMAKKSAEVISWDCHTYWWPDTIVTWNANRLSVSLGRAALQLRSSAELLKFFYGGGDFGALPMIYQAIVSRDLIERARSKFGHYFAPADMPPDVTSGIVNCLMTGQHLHSTEPLAVRGNSKKSTGTAYWARALGEERRREYHNEEMKTLAETCHSAIIASPNLNILIANAKLRCKEALFPERDDLRIDLGAVVDQIIQTLNFEPEAYEANLADALRLADKIGKSVNRKTIPPKSAIKRSKFQGFFGSNPKDFGVFINCDQAGIRDVAAAARLAESMTKLPPELVTNKREPMGDV